MPTHTPSPHRFLASIPPITQKPKSKPQSGLRNALAIQTPKSTAPTLPKAELQFKKLTPAKRFVVAPERHSTTTSDTPDKVSETKDDDEVWMGSRVQVTPRPKPKRAFERVESIEEASQSSPVVPPDEDGGEDVLQSIEHGAVFAEEESNDHDDEEEDEMLFEPTGRNKRRRISPPSSPSRQQLPEPQTPSPAYPSTTHRFKIPAPRTPASFAPIIPSHNNHAHASSTTTTTATTTPPAPHRPHFLLPALPTSPPKPSKPLPEIFSPSRKTGKYIPHGLASTLTSWIIETANTGYAATERSVRGEGGVVWGRHREDGVRLRLRVSSVSSGAGKAEEGNAEVECFAGGVVFVWGDAEPVVHHASRATSVGGDDVGMRVLLAGLGGARGAGGVKIRCGSVVGVRQPMWDVDVSGVKWVVGVDWVVLS